MTSLLIIGKSALLHEHAALFPMYAGEKGLDRSKIARLAHLLPVPMPIDLHD
jgi:hypothetical protein